METCPVIFENAILNSLDVRRLEETVCKLNLYQTTRRHLKYGKCRCHCLENVRYYFVQLYESNSGKGSK
jgi:hypothetical protein